MLSERWRGSIGEKKLQKLAQVLEQEVDPDVPAQDLDNIFEEREDIPARNPRERERAPAAALPAAIDPRMW